MTDISSILSSYAEIVNKMLEKYVPKKVDERTMTEIFGAAEYRYEPESINKGIFEPFWDLLERGGKRWRPALMLMIYEALGGKIEEIAPLSIIPEVIHNGTLAVDDVEDESEFRRGKPCIHKIYGADIAINMGNFMYYFPLTVLDRVGVGEEKKLAILDEYVKLMIRLSLGQAMDISWHRGLVEKVDEEQYLQMTLFKTGALAGFAAKLASIMAEAPEDVSEKLRKFAELIAVAFQIQDDILNIIGEEEKYGKEIGGDITEGKRTIMVIHALRNLPEKEARRLMEILNKKTGEKNLIREAINLLKKAGSVDYAKKVARDLAEQALMILRQAVPDNEGRRKLEALAEFLISREY